MINNNMIYGVGDLLIGNPVTIPSYMTLGSVSDTLTANDLITSGELSRQILGSKTRTGNVVKYTSNFLSSSSPSVAINSVGLFNSSVGGNLWSNMLMASLLQTTSYDLDLEFWFQVVSQ